MSQAGIAKENKTEMFQIKFIMTISTSFRIPGISSPKHLMMFPTAMVLSSGALSDG